MCETHSILKSKMNQNLCDILYVNTINIIVHVYIVIAHKLWLNVALCIEKNFYMSPINCIDQINLGSEYLANL
jgi:hypothetical protein